MQHIIEELRQKAHDHGSIEAQLLGAGHLYALAADLVTAAQKLEVVADSRAEQEKEIERAALGACAVVTPFEPKPDRALGTRRRICSKAPRQAAAKAINEPREGEPREPEVETAPEVPRSNGHVRTLSRKTISSLVEGVSGVRHKVDYDSYRGKCSEGEIALARQFNRPPRVGR